MHEDVEGTDWNEGHPDHEGEMAVSQLHRIAEMAEMLLDIIGEDDDLPGWVQYKFSRAYNDLNDAFGYIESKSHDMENETGLPDMGDFGGAVQEAKKKKGLWANIHARRKAGKRPKRPGEKGYPKTLDIESVVRSTIRSLVEKEIKG